MKKRIISLVAGLILITSISPACENKTVKLTGVGIDRCVNPQFTLVFDKKHYMTINKQDAERLYTALKPYFEH